MAGPESCFALIQGSVVRPNIGDWLIWICLLFGIWSLRFPAGRGQGHGHGKGRGMADGCAKWWSGDSGMSFVAFLGSEAFPPSIALAKEGAKEAAKEAARARARARWSGNRARWSALGNLLLTCSPRSLSAAS